MKILKSNLYMASYIERAGIVINYTLCTLTYVRDPFLILCTKSGLRLRNNLAANAFTLCVIH